jgi:hypothetical protein
MGIPQCSSLKMLGVIFQSNNRFNEHVKNILNSINKSLFVIRTLRKEGFSQAEVDHLFIAIVLPKIRNGLSVYGASKPELTTIQNLLADVQKDVIFLLK